MTQLLDLGLVGLGVMGKNLALNLADRGFSVAVHDTRAAAIQELMQAANTRAVTACGSLPELARMLHRPRLVLLTVPAGDAVETVLGELKVLLEPGDVVADCGNSHYCDTGRRAEAFAGRGIELVGAGISGGAEGARRGPSIMAGGSGAALQRVGPIFRAIAARYGDEACYAALGPAAAGHFVKTVHNGIEYAAMQLLAEAYLMLHHGLRLPVLEIRDVFTRWQETALDSYLVRITAEILGKTDPENGVPLIDRIADEAGQKGTGHWALTAALEHGVPAPLIATAVLARYLTADRAGRTAARARFGSASGDFGTATGDPVEELHAALHASLICAYAQGFAVLAAARRQHGWPADLQPVARIWRAGCIVRAKLLDRIVAAYARAPELANPMWDEAIAAALAEAQAPWRRIVGAAIRCGLPIPALSAGLAYFDAYRSAHLGANLIQVQRDYFGQHGYRRTDRTGVFHLP